MDVAARAQLIDAEATALVATLPDLPSTRLAALEADARALAGVLDRAPAAVAAALAAVIAEYRAGRAALEGWGVVASAAHALARAAATPTGAGGLAAVVFELETLLPPRAAAPARTATPDVPLTALVRRT